MKVFTRGEADARTNVLKENLKAGNFIAVEGTFMFDDYSKEVSLSNVTGIRISDFIGKIRQRKNE